MRRLGKQSLSIARCIPTAVLQCQRRRASLQVGSLCVIVGSNCSTAPKLLDEGQPEVGVRSGIRTSKRHRRVAVEAHEQCVSTDEDPRLFLSKIRLD